MNGTAGVVRGALAGLAGTTMMMRVVAPNVVPQEMRPDEFVPKKVVEWVEQQAGRRGALDENQDMKAAILAHFTYGTSMGAVYGLLRRRLAGLPAPLAGALFGVTLWGVGFEGWLPALGVDRATTQKPPKKWPMPIMAHVICTA